MERPHGHLYDPKGCSKEQRVWVRDLRDEGRCQFYLFDGQWLACNARHPQARLEVHHIYPQGLMHRIPQPWGGETPYNLITLCQPHHDLQTLHMGYARDTYKFDRTSYERWIGMAHDATQKGDLSFYNRDWEAMLKQIARFRTDFFTQVVGGESFPYKANRLKGHPIP